MFSGIDIAHVFLFTQSCDTYIFNLKKTGENQ